ncbi:hypothetical protein PBI_ZEECULATE_55 [Mycobacterium phage Zeeculate]|nr:hypothetical protein PBI_ZEECULATE_55 [Mycobacterium phage Zeeculate]
MSSDSDPSLRNPGGALMSQGWMKIEAFVKVDPTTDTEDVYKFLDDALKQQFPYHEGIEVYEVFRWNLHRR